MHFFKLYANYTKTKHRCWPCKRTLMSSQWAYSSWVTWCIWWGRRTTWPNSRCPSLTSLDNCITLTIWALTKTVMKVSWRKISWNHATHCPTNKNQRARMQVMLLTKKLTFLVKEHLELRYLSLKVLRVKVLLHKTTSLRNRRERSHQASRGSTSTKELTSFLAKYWALNECCC